jgi:predicted peptidase
MGGFGTFRAACEYPERFAAIVPVSGGGELEQALTLTDVPTYAFHGNADDVVSYDLSKNMIDAMQKSNAKEAKLKTLHGKGHGIMCDVYSDKEVWRWMLAHELEK